MKMSKIIISTSLFCYTLLAAFVSASPSFNCATVKDSSIEQLICSDEELSELDIKLSKTFKEAEAKASNRLPILKATQRGWIKGRNDCWKEDDQRNCVLSNYKMRISEIQVEYDLIGASSSLIYICLDDPKMPLEVTFYPTEISTAKAKRGDQVSIMYGKPVTDGVLYNGPNESISILKAGVKLRWGYGSVEASCDKTN